MKSGTFTAKHKMLSTTHTIRISRQSGIRIDNLRTISEKSFIDNYEVLTTVKPKRLYKLVQVINKNNQQDIVVNKLYAVCQWHKNKMQILGGTYLILPNS